MSDLVSDRLRLMVGKGLGIAVALIVTIIGLSILPGGRPGSASALGSCSGGQPYHHNFSIKAAGYERTDKPVEIRLNLTNSLADQNASGSINLKSLCVDELDGNNVIDNNVPFQFDPAENYHAASKARGILTVLMTGSTAPSTTRHYRLYFDTASGYTAPGFTDRVALTDNVNHKGYPSLHLITSDAEYFYHKPGGGFATLLDKNGDDWISWNSAAGAAGDFRGIPNMVHPNDGGYFHPGRDNSTTTVLSDGPLKATFKSTSQGSAAWEVLWDVFPGYARMTIVRKGTSNFWWLYEGTPGGLLQPTVDTLTRSDGSSIKASGTWTTDIPGDEWVYVTDPNSGSNGRSLFLIHHQTDTKVDGYTADNSNKMTIFGFGRSGNSRQLNTLPQQFTFGFADETSISALTTVIEDAYQPLVITGENDGDGGGPGPDPDPTCDPLNYSVYVSPKKNATINGLAVADEDVAKYDGATCLWSLVFDGTAKGLPVAANVDALAVRGEDLYLSFLVPLAVPGIPGKVDDSDVVLFRNGVFSLYLDGSNRGLTTSSEDIDAIAFDEGGNLLVSTLGAVSVPGIQRGQDEDLLRLNGNNWELYFDGSHNAGLGSENVAGVDVAGSNGDIYLSVMDAFTVGGVKGNGTNIFVCEPLSLGALSTRCDYTSFWRSADFGLSAFSGIDIE